MPFRRKTGPRVPDFALPEGVKPDGDRFSATVRLPYGHEHVKRGFATPDKAAAYIKDRSARVAAKENPRYEALMSNRRLAHLKPSP